MYSTNRRAILEVIPPRLRKLWKEWDLRLTILLSLILQLLLSILGNHRKHNRNTWIRILLWSAYTATDSLAIFAFGLLSNNLFDILEKGTTAGHVGHPYPSVQLAMFWAQFLLLHLGGPDSITAYDLEDNKLWLRQLLGLVSQTCGAINVFILAWTGKGSRLSILSILIFIAGFNKYGERTWVLREVSNQIRKKTVLKQHRVEISRERCPQTWLQVDLSGFTNNSISEEEKFLAANRLLLGMTKRLFEESALSFSLKDGIQIVFRNISFEDGFEINEIQLGMIYDLLYTKAPLLYSRKGLGLRLITFFLICSSMVFFSLLDGKHNYSKIDLSITFLLLLVAVLLEIYAALLVLCSDWFFVWLSKNNKKISSMKALTWFPLLKTPRWSNRMSQYTLLSFKNKKRVPAVLRSFHKHWDSEKKPMECSSHQRYAKDVLRSITTEVSYYIDRDRKDIPEDLLADCKAIKRISRYMLHLLVMNPSMISAETGLMAVSFEGISYGAFKYGRDVKDNKKTQIYNEFLKEDFIGYKVDYGNDSLVLHNAMKLVTEMEKEIEEMETRMAAEHHLRKKWEKIGKFWLEMVGYAATKSKGSDHAQQLRHGGEFLTHVWLLMAHFGLTQHFQLSNENHVGRIISK
ncbi:hypothetical protein QYF36_018259 [Acer negundo]|nr:hypothetical protein QYF36_018259 [Acer negundo]